MYETIADLMKSFSTHYPVLWALLITALVAAASLVLYVVWELALRALLSPRCFRRKSQGDSE